MQQSWYRSPYLWCFLLSAVLLVWISTNVKWYKGWKGIILSDAIGYYAYLPATFVYGDLNFAFYDSLLVEDEVFAATWQDFRNYHHGKAVNKYYVGTAVLQTPFFLLGHWGAQLSGAETSGFSRWYYYLFHLGAICYVLLGLWGVKRLLDQIEVDQAGQAWILVGLLWGTNLGYYVMIEPGMSHVYNFTVIAWWCYVVLNWGREPRAIRWLVAASLLTGLLTILRPINVLVFLGMPFLLGKEAMQKVLAWIPRNVPTLMLAAIPGLLVVAIQLVIYYLQTGSFWVYSYDDEGFNFTNPHLWGGLFGYRKGFFLYNPLLFVGALLGLIFLFRQDTFRAWSWLAFFTFLSYILTSWHDWGYGGGFSMRPYIDYYAFFALLMGWGWKVSKRSISRRIWWVMLAMFVVVAQIQTYQYRKNIIHYYQMDREQYWDNFLRIDKLLAPKPDPSEDKP